MATTIALSWLPDWGGVRFQVAEAPVGYTMFIIAPGDQLESIRGYEDDSWISGGVGFGYSFEMPLGVTVRYGLAPVGSTVWPGTGTWKAIGTPEGQAWLRDLYDPTMSQKITVISTGDESRPARQSVLRVSGRDKPIVLWDVREGRQGTIQIAVANFPPPGVWQKTYRDYIDDLLNTGRPLLLSMCQSKGFDPCYMAVADATYTRIGTQAAWVLNVDYTEIDNPVDVAVMIPVEISYADRQTGSPTYSAWNSTYADYLALAVL